MIVISLPVRIFHDGTGKVVRMKNMVIRWYWPSLILRPLPDFISQPWRKIGRKLGIKTTSQTGNDGLG